MAKFSLVSMMLIFFILSMTGFVVANHTVTAVAKTFSLPFRYGFDPLNHTEVMVRYHRRMKSLFQRLVEGNATITSIPSEFLATFEVGFDEDTQVVDLIVDPGSYFVWWQCNCDVAGGHCYNQTNGTQIYKISFSTSYSKVICEDKQACLPDYTHCGLDYSNLLGNTTLCRYNASYGGGFYSEGTISKENVIFKTGVSDDTIEVPINFGCGEYQQPDNAFPPESSGMLGLSNNPYSLPNQLNATAFSVCLPSRKSATTSSIDFYTIWFQPDVEKDFIITDLIERPEGNSAGFYFVEIEQIQVGSTKVDVPSSIYGFQSGSGSIVDFGCTLTLLPGEAFGKLRDLFAAQVESLNPQLSRVQVQGFDGCYGIPTDMLNQYVIPNVSITFGPTSAVYSTRTPDQVMINVNQDVACLAFDSSPDNIPFTILGNVLFQRIRTHFGITERKIAFEYDGCT